MSPATEWTIATLTSLSQVGYTGKIELNYFKGGITGVNFSQSIKPMQEVRIVPIGNCVEVQLN
jgi:hypothetical protein